MSLHCNPYQQGLLLHRPCARRGYHPAPVRYGVDGQSRSPFALDELGRVLRRSGRGYGCFVRELSPTACSTNKYVRSCTESDDIS